MHPWQLEEQYNGRSGQFSGADGQSIQARMAYSFLSNTKEGTNIIQFHTLAFTFLSIFLAAGWTAAQFL